ncbi:DUF3290 domain-containing protein [Liquorilactobacillus satsumensis]|uniref:DUF3290 domain-containing protein n=5 Tax=Lactobacillaceae TaxID=33958 RepID=UPI0007054B7E|nr:DUF3290 domain-containing protein [Liquorilactobacillus satsumensis]MCP9312029.1 DUF3290 domain-containing protein [Liquorilactobacillus satsumensis]MCP9329637.1 DUF3290 domain-containing protein [Liquorilactobacillus satsumensis]MCP9358356.1 DUF3290 domain-containing protein [Liquorilactobacillus satsumensis]MCP9359163.1 DUF3290 domain-containing protein [Liquorilactobacillus satsumensis]MCP9372339.1 DUF3290 domain-containing protein [Liquorilactobacillus satsumensis]
MTFFGINFIENQLHLSNFIKYFVTGLLVLALIIAITLYLRHRIQVKYRDLSIIVFLLLLFMLGLQYSDYTQAKNQHAQSFQMVTFITQIAQEKHVRKKTIFVNSTQLSDGIVVKLKNAYYRVNLNANQTDYTLTRTHLIDSQINIKK